MEKHIEKAHKRPRPDDPAAYVAGVHAGSAAAAPSVGAMPDEVQQWPVVAALRKLSMPVERQAEAVRRFAKAFVHAGVSMNVIDDPYLNDALAYVAPGFDVPGRTHLSEAADRLAEQLRSKVAAHVATAEGVAITTDSATTVAGDSLEAITAHFIGPKWEMFSVVLAVYLMDDTGSAAYLCEIVNTVLKEWNIAHAISMTTGALLAARPSVVLCSLALLPCRGSACLMDRWSRGLSTCVGGPTAGPSGGPSASLPVPHHQPLVNARTPHSAC